MKANMNTNTNANTNALPVTRAFELEEVSESPQWLIEDLWAEQAVGILGGEPKCCKTFLALDMAVSVASASPCLRHFPVLQPGRVLLFPAEDSAEIVRRRLDGISQAAGKELADLDIHVITAPTVRIHTPRDRERLSRTIEHLQPTLLILDPFIRLHSIDENTASEVSPLLGYLRELQRRFRMAIVLVHHAKKGAGKQRPGQALRGSSDLHGWGDSNLYLRRIAQRLSLTTEHRGAPSQDDIPLHLTDLDSTPSLVLLNTQSIPQPAEEAIPSPDERVRQALAGQADPLTFHALRERCRIRAATLSSTLKQMVDDRVLIHSNQGYQLLDAQPGKSVSDSQFPIGGEGNGIGKQPS